MKKTIKQKIQELDDMKKNGEITDYGIHPLYCSCLMHQGGKRLSFDSRVVITNILPSTKSW